MALKYFICELRLAPAYRDEANQTEQMREIISNHFNYLKARCDTGKLLLAGRTDLSISNVANHGIVIFTAVSESEAREVMNNDPAVVSGVMTAQLFPFALALLGKAETPA